MNTNEQVPDQDNDGRDESAQPERQNPAEDTPSPLESNSPDISNASSLSSSPLPEDGSDFIPLDFGEDITTGSVGNADDDDGEVRMPKNAVPALAPEECTSLADAFESMLPRVNPADLKWATAKGTPCPCPLDMMVTTTVKIAAEALSRAERGLATWQGETRFYNGTHWEVQGRQNLGHALGILAVARGDFETRATYVETGEKLFKQLQYDTHVEPPERGDTALVNLNNGTLEVSAQGFHLREHRRGDYLTYCLPYDFDPSATAPRFERYLTRCLPDPDVRRLTAEAVAVGFTPGPALKLEKIPVMLGVGANGKSVLHEIVMGLLGKQNVSAQPLADLGHEYNRYELQFPILNYGSEIGGSIAPDTLKRIASLEPITARIPHGRVVQLTSYARCIFNANEMPPVTDYSGGFWRRWLVIPWEVIIPPAERDIDLHRRIKDSELPGVLNWVLAGLKRLVANKRFSPCAASDAAMEEWRRDADSIKGFLEDEGWEANPEASYPLTATTGDGFYNQYADYARANGMGVIGLRKICRRLRGLRVESKKTATGRVVMASKRMPRG